MAKENISGSGAILPNTSSVQDLSYLNRLSPLSLVSFLMFVLSWVYIGTGLWKGFVIWPYVDETVGMTKLGLAAICTVIGVSLLRLYISLWRIERDVTIANKLRAKKDSFGSRVSSFIELLLRFAALIVMYFLVGNLAKTDFFRVFSKESEFCLLLVAVFAIFFMWDLFAVPRLIKGLSKKDSDWVYFMILAAADFLCLVCSVIYSVFVLKYENYTTAGIFIAIFGGILIVVLIIEMLCTYESIRRLIKEIYVV